MVHPLDNLPIYVISLTRATARRQKIKTQLDKHRLKFEFIDATDERQGLSKDEIELLGIDNLQKHNNRTSPGAIGCLISHLRCYKKIIESNANQALILEDDVVLSKDFMPVMEHLIGSSINFYLLQLSSLFPHPSSLPYIGRKSYPLNFWKKRKLDLAAEQLDQQYYLGPLAGNGYCSHCYLISRSGCEFSLQHYKSLPYNIDSLMNIAGIPNRFSIMPSLGIQPYEDTYIDYGVTLLIDEMGNISSSPGITIEKSGYKNKLWNLIKMQSPSWSISLARTFLVLFLSKSSAYYTTKLKNYFLKQA